jgi:hypothetical protein
MKRLLTILILFATYTKSQSQETVPEIKRIDPTNWWVGMKNSKLQLLVYGTNAGTLTYSINYPGVRIVSSEKVENPNYAFLNLLIAPTAKPGTLHLLGKSGSKTITKSYELKARTKEVKGSGVNSSDLIYLIIPDRFSNGDPSNDKFSDMADTDVDTSNPYLRHGGDLQGIINHLDYLKEMGVTALWLTPVI